jgi:hypothetical protein
MKIYVPGTPLTTIYKKIHLLDKYLKGKSTKMVVYSIDGIFIVDATNVKKMCILSNQTYKCNVSGIDFIIDESKIEYKNEYYIPGNHKINNILEFKYMLHPKSNLTLVVEGDYDEKLNRPFTPTNFYFETKIEEKINNSIIKNDLFEFLSLLN